MAILVLLLSACNETNESLEPTQTPPEEQPQEEQPIIEQEESTEGTPPTSIEVAETVMELLKDGDMGNLAAWAHPEKGIRFSPYAYVDKETDLVFSKDELKNLMEDSKLYVWRTFAGSGDLIEMKYTDYHKQFVYDADFVSDAKIALNEVIGEGTTINNLNEVYPMENHDFVEYHIDGIDPSYDGMDWRSVRLVFEKIGDDHALVGIIHDQWTP
ncbi:MAG: hypothetical protein ABWX61_04725 [Paenisporosarcina sp.]